MLINDNDDGETYKVLKKYSKRKKYYTTWNILGVFITFDSRQSLHVSVSSSFSPAISYLSCGHGIHPFMEVLIFGPKLSTVIYLSI